MKFANKIFTGLTLVLFACTTFSQPTYPAVSALFEAAMDSIDPPIPLVHPLFPYHLRDVAVCKGPDHHYYLTGTTDDNWGVADGIRVWKSKNLKDWELLGNDGFVWTFERDASNEAQKKIVVRNNRFMRGIWAPEIHYLKENFWITYSVSNGYGSGLLRSTSGKPEGPYVDVDPDNNMVSGIDATLFEDEDGTVWYIWGPGKMKKMKADMLGFENDDEPVFPRDASEKKVGYEGVNMYRKNGIYYLMAAEWNAEGPNMGHTMRETDVNRRAADGRYDCMIAMSEHLAGPYSKAYIALAHGGHNMIFDDYEGNTWATMFGNDEAAAPFREYAALVQMKFDDEQKLGPVLPHPFEANESMPVIYVSPGGKKPDGKSWKTAFPSLQAAIDASTPETQIWVAKGEYSETVRIENYSALYIYGGFEGTEKRLADRNLLDNTVVLDGKGEIPHVLSINNSEYLRIDGITIRGGSALGEDEMGCGAGLILKGGGESVRFANCIIRNNYAIKNGGGLYATEGAAPLFIGCRFLQNEARENGGAAYVECDKANGYHTRFYNCDLSYNKAWMNGGVAYIRTDLKQTGTLRFINCLISNNFTLLEGGNIVLAGGATLLMSHCTVAKNTGMSKGTAIAALGRIPAQNRIVNSIFAGNYGGVLFTSDAYDGADPTSSRIQNWTQILHCLFHDNRTLGICGYTHKSDRYTDISKMNASTWAEGNILADPGFIDPVNGNYRLNAGSPAIGRGTADNAFPFDFEGQRRTIDFINLNNTVDIGFDEFIGQ